MARPIDAYQAIDIIDEWLDSVGTVMVGKGLSSYGELIGCIEDAPTLTPQNEPLTCEGCAEIGKWENEYECGYPSPRTRCKRRACDNYRRPPERQGGDANHA